MSTPSTMVKDQLGKLIIETEQANFLRPEFRDELFDNLIQIGILNRSGRFEEASKLSLQTAESCTAEFGKVADRKFGLQVESYVALASLFISHTIPSIPVDTLKEAKNIPVQMNFLQESMFSLLSIYKNLYDISSKHGHLRNDSTEERTP